MEGTMTENVRRAIGEIDGDFPRYVLELLDLSREIDGDIKNFDALIAEKDAKIEELKENIESLKKENVRLLLQESTNDAYESAMKTDEANRKLEQAMEEIPDLEDLAGKELSY